MSDKANMGSNASVDNLDRRLKAVYEPRWIATRYASNDGRRRLVALYMFNHELERATRVSEPMIARIRLQWWREALLASFQGEGARRHEVLAALDRAFEEEPEVREGLLSLIDGWARLIENDEPPIVTDRLLASLACLCVAPDADSATIERVIATATADKREDQRKFCGDLEARFWPAFVDVAARNSQGQAHTGLAARWRIFWAVARRSL